MPTVAIVGRPNVGKSALFNRLAGRKIAIVHDQPGVTRDRIAAPSKATQTRCTLVDTGGIGGNIDDGFDAQVTIEADIAMETSDLILFVVDAHDGLTATDQVDFVDWMVSRSGVSAIRLGPLTAHLEQAAGEAFVLVQTLDLGLIGLTMLYRSRRVSADLYLQILGGFVRPAIVH